MIQRAGWAAREAAGAPKASGQDDPFPHDGSENRARYAAQHGSRPPIDPAAHSVSNHSSDQGSDRATDEAPTQAREVIPAPPGLILGGNVAMFRVRAFLVQSGHGRILGPAGLRVKSAGGACGLRLSLC